MELYRKYRPKNFDEIVGQPEAVDTLESLLERKKAPHVYLFAGPTGTGKTTLARIVLRRVGCKKYDLCEHNSATFRGIDSVREIQANMGRAPFGKARGWILDEFHRSTKDAQEGMLKVLEDTPSHVYFALCTTEPQKLLPTIKGRCTEIKLKAISDKALKTLIGTVKKKEKIKISEEVQDKIAEVAAGSARKALVLLHQVSEIKKESKQLDAIQRADIEKQAIDLVRMLTRPRCTWAEVAPMIKAIDEDPESIRRLMLAYASSIVLNQKNFRTRALAIIECFSDNYYDTGKAGLIWSCCELLASGNRR